MIDDLGSGAGASAAPEAGSPWQTLGVPRPLGSPQVTDLRPELCQDSAQLARLHNPLPARVLRLPAGAARFDWFDPDTDCFGVMLLDGLLLAELSAGRAHTGWLLGPQDLVRPSGMRELALTEEVSWRALLPTTLALLDREFGLRAGGVPMVSRVLVARATRTTSWLLASSLILTSPQVEERLLLLFALLGERWGKVSSDGVMLRLPLTHAMLASLCGARRPAVTMALHALRRDGLLSCSEKGQWLLRRAPSLAGNDDSPSGLGSLAQYERALGLSWPAADDSR